MKNVPVKFQEDPDPMGMNGPVTPDMKVCKFDTRTGDMTLPFDIRDKWLRCPIRSSLAVTRLTRCHHHSRNTWIRVLGLFSLPSFMAPLPRPRLETTASKSGCCVREFDTACDEC